jgi:hemolysin III
VGAYFMLRLARGWAEGLTAGIWTVAALGIAANLWKPRGIVPISTVLYLALGWIGVVAAGPFTAALATSTLVLLAVGGMIYSVGVVFHLWRRLRYQNAIWHGFVRRLIAVKDQLLLRQRRLSLPAATGAKTWGEWNEE